MYSQDETVTIKELPLIISAGKIVLSDNPGKLLGEHRRLNGVTKTELGNNLNMSIQLIAKYENGIIEVPGSRIVKNWLEAIQQIKSLKYIKDNQSEPLG
ncbi:MAG: hypothetical protein ABIH20_04435 [Candidatus Diapherotrites archaeon]